MIPAAGTPSDITPEEALICSAKSIALQRFEAALTSAEEIVREESEALKRGDISALAEFAVRKSKGLLDLERAAAALQPDNVVRPRERIARLANALEENDGLLQANHAAVQEIVELIANAIRQEQSDGTYAQTAIGSTQ